MPTTDKRPLKVFLCHAHADRDPVRALYTRLTDDGVDAWFDKEKLLPGQDWELEIKKAVREADVVVVCLSKQFNQAGFRQKEVRWALDTAMEQPEGEIFIIPARLEKCENLESLQKWHEVNLFEDDGYERMMRAVQTRAEKFQISHNENDYTEKKNHLSESPVIDGLNWEVVNGSIIFNSRLSDAFPGLRESKIFYGSEAIERLRILLRSPLSVNITHGIRSPFWWFRGLHNMYISNFEPLDESRILLDIEELFVDFIVVVRAFADEERNFLYLQTKPEAETGLYKYEEGWIQKYLDARLQKNHGFFYAEEYAEWNTKLITRAEYDDGSAVINGKPIRVSGANLRRKYLTPYNLVVCGQNHVLNNTRVDSDFTKIMDEILLGKKTVDELVEFVDGLPKVFREKII